MDVTMLRGIAIETMEITASSYVVGNIAAHTFTFDTPIPLLPENQILIIYPPETFPPSKLSQCSGGEGFADEQACTVIQNVVKTTAMEFRKSQGIFDVESLEIGAKASFTIDESSNPQTQRATSAYKFYIKDANGDTMAEMTFSDKSEMMLRMTEPHPITTFELKPIDDRQLALTAYELTFTSKMPYPKGSYMMIQIDRTVVGPRDEESVSDVKCSSNL